MQQKKVIVLFCETDTMENRDRLRILKRKRSTKFIMLPKKSSVRTVATACSMSQTTAHRIIVVEPYKDRFVQKFDKEDFHERVEMCQTLISTLETRKFLFFPLNYF